MDHLDTYYRALLEYRELTDNSPDCARIKRRAIAHGQGTEKIIVKRAHCKVDEEWVEEIERGLVHIEKALREERQFIFSNGEVVPIEKVKHISTESVKHLAKHSEMLTKEPEDDGEIIPDKLYSVERLNDYTVYENRFLYMLLCYLRDFITYRYNKILSVTNRYDGSLVIDREITVGKESLSFKLDMKNIKEDDKYMREHNLAKEIIDRIDIILKTVLSFLATPLMEYQSKVPMLRPPITKTNVLKMDNNFKGAVALYDYIISYDKEGFTIDEETRELDPFVEELAMDMYEPVLLLSFLTYEYGLDIKDSLKAQYDSEEARRREDLIRQNAERLSALQKRINVSGGDVNEYLLALESHIRTLEREIGKLPALRALVESLTEEKEALEYKIEVQRREILEVDKRIESVRNEYSEEIQRVNDACSRRIVEIIASNEDGVREIKAAHLSEIEGYNQRIRELIEAQKVAEGELLGKISELEGRISALRKDYEELCEAKRVCTARYLALKYKEGALEKEDKFTSREDFLELEAEYESFKKFFDEEWKRTKREIRRDVFSIKNFKERKKQDKS